ncbi:MAG: cytidine deaminase [Anaerolineales bacterium]
MSEKLSSEIRAQLIEAAKQARQWAYAPYSHYLVGAAVLTSSGRIYDGVNIENAAFPATVCAERVALFKAISEGERQFIALAVVTNNGGTPCGICRQVLAEFGLDTTILVANDSGEIKLEISLQELLPLAFGADKLK